MKLNRLKICAAALLTAALPARAQYYTTGADPHDTQWMQIATPRCRIVFDRPMERQALRLAGVIDSVAGRDTRSLLFCPPRIDIVLHSRTQYSNGLVTWAPARMELYTTPSQSVGSTVWLDHLAWHEYRHVAQTSSLRVGLTHGASWLLGQQAVGIVVGLGAPLWLLEGDAVAAETAHTRAGRGRDAAFEQEMRAQTLEKGIYHYSKAYLGSYADYVPNHYNMGYLLVSDVRIRYGADVWGDALASLGRRWSMDAALKRRTGLGKRRLYAEAMDRWRQLWAAQDSALAVSAFSPLTAAGPDYASYTFARPWGRLTVAQKSGPHITPRFVAIGPDGSETTLLRHGRRTDEPHSICGDTMVWSELENDLRWENRTWQNLMLMNLKTGERRRLTRRARLAAPAISPDGTVIAAVETDSCGLQSILMLTVGGRRLRSIRPPHDECILTPAWHPAGRRLFAILLDADGKRIAALDTATGLWSDLTPPTQTPVKGLWADGGFVYFTSSATGIDNIYRIDERGGREPQQLTSARFGAAFACTRGDTLIYSNYTSQGYTLVSAPGQPVNTPAPPSPMLATADTLTRQEGGTIDLPAEGSAGLAVGKYSKWNLWNFHSWAPAFVDVDESTLSSGVSVMSQNLLGTSMLVAGVDMASDHTLNRYRLSYTYRGLLPVFKLEATHGFSHYAFDDAYRMADDTTHGFVRHCDDKARRTQLKLRASVPMSVSCGEWTRRIEPYVATEYSFNTGYDMTLSPISLSADGRWHYDGQPQTLNAGRFDYTDIQYGIFLSNTRRSSLCDVGSRWQQTLEIRYRHTPCGTDIGSCLGALARLRFPGIGRHHYTQLTIGAQRKTAGEVYGTSGGIDHRYLYSDFVSFPRGCHGEANDRMLRWSVSYRLPLCCPDISWGPMVYLKRLKLNAFYDRANGSRHIYLTEGGRQRRTFSKESVGAELTADCHFLNLSFPFEIGYRHAYLPDTGRHAGEFLLSIGLSGAM